MIAFFRILLGIDALAAAVVAFFFMWGLSDGSVSSFNIGIWLALVAGVCVVLAGGIILKSIGQPLAAIGLLLILAMPATLFGLFFLLVDIL